MPKHMWRNITINTRLFRIFFQHTPDRLLTKAPSAPVDKEKIRFVNARFICTIIFPQYIQHVFTYYL